MHLISYAESYNVQLYTITPYINTQTNEITFGVPKLVALSRPLPFGLPIPTHQATEAAFGAIGLKALIDWNSVSNHYR